MSETIEQKCQSQGVKLTDQRRIIAKVISESKKAYGESVSYTHLTLPTIAVV